MSECGTCTLCCKLLGVESIHKSPGQWCEHCIKTSGCSIYDSRPQECRVFECYWKLVDGPPELRPDKVHMVISDVSERLGAFKVYVDPAYPRAWATGKGKQMLERLTKHQPRFRNIALTIGDKRLLLQRMQPALAGHEREGT
jgi:uncharacterized protein